MKIFLDTNYYIDIVSRQKRKLQQLTDHEIFISPLSVHIFCYIAKIKTPAKYLIKFNQLLNQVPLNSDIMTASLEGPTSDVADNVQLHSAARTECQFFLTEDKELLKMVYFGTVKIINKL